MSLKKKIAACLVTLLLTSTQIVKADALDLKSYPKQQRDVIAQKLQEGEICKKDLISTTEKFNECTASSNRSLVVIVGVASFLVGALIGASIK